MTKKVYVGNLPFQTTEAEVRALFSPHGRVISVAMVNDRETGRFRGFCFVEMEPKAAGAAIAALNGREVKGRKIRVSQAKERKRQEKKGPAKSSPQQDVEPHTRTSRGSYISQDEFPYSGGGTRRSSWSRGSNNDDSDFPFSGGGTRRSRN